MRSWRNGRTSTPGFLDDHAGLALGLYSLYGATGEIEWYKEATWLVGQIDRFTNAGSGFFSTPEDAPSLIKRPVDIMDNPLPSGNALAAEALLLTTLYTGDMAQRTKAVEALQSAGPLIERYPSMVARHLAVSYSMSKTKELAIVGPDWKSLARVYWSRFRPHAVVAGSEAGEDDVPLLRDRHQPGTTQAYLCKGFVCDLPTSDPVVLRDLLE